MSVLTTYLDTPKSVSLSTYTQALECYTELLFLETQLLTHPSLESRPDLYNHIIDELTSPFGLEALHVEDEGLLGKLRKRLDDMKQMIRNFGRRVWLIHSVEYNDIRDLSQRIKNMPNDAKQRLDDHLNDIQSTFIVKGEYQTFDWYQDLIQRFDEGVISSLEAMISAYQKRIKEDIDDPKQALQDIVKEAKFRGQSIDVGRCYIDLTSDTDKSSYHLHWNNKKQSCNMSIDQVLSFLDDAMKNYDNLEGSQVSKSQYERLENLFKRYKTVLEEDLKGHDEKSNHHLVINRILAKFMTIYKELIWLYNVPAGCVVDVFKQINKAVNKANRKPKETQ